MHAYEHNHGRPRWLLPWLLAGLIGLTAVAFSTPAFAQLGSNRTTAASARNSGFGTQATQGFGAGSNTALSQASQNVGSVLGADQFGGAGGGSLLRTAIESQTLSGINAQNQFSALGALGGMGGGFGMGGMGRGGQFGQMGGQFGQMGNTNNQQRGATLRIPMRIGFSLPVSVVLERATKFESRLPNIPGLEKIRGVEVKLAGRTAILQGTVATDRERDLIARLAMLEPGISAIENELEVAPPGPLGALPAPDGR